MCHRIQSKSTFFSVVELISSARSAWYQTVCVVCPCGNVFSYTILHIIRSTIQNNNFLLRPSRSWSMVRQTTERQSDETMDRQHKTDHSFSPTVLVCVPCPCGHWRQQRVMAHSLPHSMLCMCRTYYMNDPHTHAIALHVHVAGCLVPCARRSLIRKH